MNTESKNTRKRKKTHYTTCYMQVTPHNYTIYCSFHLTQTVRLTLDSKLHDKMLKAKHTDMLHSARFTVKHYHTTVYILIDVLYRARCTIFIFTRYTRSYKILSHFSTKKVVIYKEFTFTSYTCSRIAYYLQ